MTDAEFLADARMLVAAGRMVATVDLPALLNFLARVHERGPRGSDVLHYVAGKGREIAAVDDLEVLADACEEFAEVARSVGLAPKPPIDSAHAGGK